ncbi:MAG TPA: Ig-like domain-containing protein, partial [Verrucomicrobiae bacterium]|nr:Ig-like domain-containing protein [Verrucomicrobiae bacterium]
MMGRTLGRLGGVVGSGRLIVAVGLLLFFGVFSSIQAASVKSVQRGQATFASGQNTLPVTLTAVDPTKTIVWGGINWGGGRINSSTANSNRVGFQLSGATTLNLQRLGSPTQATIVDWQAIEFNSGVSVQRRDTTFGTATTTVNVPIAAVNLSESFVLISVATPSGTQNTDEEWTVRAHLTSSTNLELSRNQSGTAITVYWQVVTFTGASVQRGLTSIGAGASSAAAAISSANPATSFLLLTQRGDAAVNGIESQYMVRGQITSPTSLNFDRISTTNSVEIAWQVITLTDGSSVQAGSIPLGSAASSGTATLSAVNLSRSASFINVRGGSGTSTANLDETALTHSLTAATTLSVFRGATGTAADVGWFVVQFASGQPPVLAAIGAKSTNENQLLQFRVSATDPDATTPTLSAVGLPSGATFVDSLNGAGSFSWTPSFTQSGSYNVTFIASDGTLADSEVVAITVNNVNRAPVLNAIGAKSTNENQLLLFRVSASDPDGTISGLSAVGLPSGAVFVDSTNGAGSFTWTPTFTQSGVYNVTFIASDGSLADSEVVAVTVNNVNAPPVLAAIGAKSVDENQLLQFRISASDPDGGIPALSAAGLPPGAAFVDSLNGAGSFNWTPSFTQAGTHNVTFIAGDGGLADSEVVAITVNNVNRPPVLDPIGAKSTNENQLLQFRVSGSDPDLTTPVLSAANLPSGAALIDSLNGAGSFSWTPTFTQAGSYNVTIVASDGSLADSEVVAITVNNVNRAPVLNVIGARSTNENQLLQFRISASDPDGGVPVLSAAGLPLGAAFVDSLNGAGSFSWTPSFTQAGSYNATFIASDGSLADSEVVPITVNNVNRVPVLNAIGAKSTNENQLLQFGISASDPDGTVPTLSTVGAPSGAVFVDSLNGAGSFTWTPTFFQSGTYNVTFIASDGALADSEVVVITVNNVNRTPVLNAIGSKSTNENQLLQFRVSATDPDLTTPALSTAGLPSGVVFVDSTNGAGSFSWTPTYFQAGTYNVTFVASDGSLADSEAVTITVNNVPQAPILNGIGAKSTNENQLLQFRVSAVDPDGTIPALSIVGLPSGAVFVDSTNGAGSFTWTPDFFQSGNYNVTFIASDGSLADSEVVTITVNNVNRAPLLNAIGAKSTNENQLLQFRVSASDPDLTTLTLSTAGLPSGAVFVDSTNGAGSFSWTPSFTQAGSYNVTFIASDGSLADSEVVAITVNNVNRAPVLNTIGSKTENENQLLQFRVSASDPDLTTPSLNAVGLPSGAAFVDSTNGAGSFSWTPSFTQSGSYNVTFIASDGSLADSEVVAITINNVNAPPVLNAIGAKSTNENQLLQFRISASDIDATVPTLSAANLPTGAVLTDSLTGAGSFSWTPSFFQSGTYNVTFIASDGSLADSEVVTITVNNVNRAPVLNAIGAKSTNENQLLQFRISSSDPDLTTPTLSAVGLPTGATFVDSLNGAGSFNWTPTFFQSGSYNVTFIASDGSLADSEVVAITVNNVNRAPVLSAIGAKSVNENQLLQFRVSASDPDLTTPALSTVGLPTGATFVDSLNGAGSFSWTPSFTQSGSYNVTFIASDGSLADSEVVTITVNNVNRAPVLNAIGAKSTNENQLLQFRVSASDPDLTTPTLSTVGLPTGATFVDSLNGAGSLNWTPTFFQSGSYNVTFIASDGSLADSEVVTITVNNVNRAPVLNAIGAKNTNENQLLQFRVSATDPDLTTPVLSAVGLPAGAAFVDSTNGAGSFNWTPSFFQSGTYNVTFIASDGSLADSEVVTITVNNVNRAPVLAAIGAKSTNENQLLQFRVSATDPDLTTPVLSTVGLPTGATFVDSANGAGSFSWTPSFTQSGSYNVTFIASDGALADSEVVTITVNNVNRAPVLNAIGAKSVNENQLLQFRVSSSDPDGTISALSTVGLPTGAIFVDSTNGAGSFSWTPTFFQSGAYNVTFIASDGSLADSEVVTITVNNVNRAPVLAAIGAKSTNENQLLQFRVSASDPDLTTPALSAAGLPAGAIFTDSLNGAGSFSWTPTFFQAGTYNVTFIASDGGLADSETVVITVNNVPRPPILDPVGAKSTNENQLLQFRVSATDPDLTTPALSAVGLPGGATFVDSTNGAGSFSWTPSFTQAGAYNVTFIASDGATADSEVVAITVNNVNRAPVLAAIGAKSTNENQLLQFRISASDPDGPIPTLSAAGLPTGATFVDSTNGAGSFSWTPTFFQSGTYNVTFIASDGSLADSEAVTITINNVNRAPVLNPIGGRSIVEGNNLAFNISSSDPDLTTPSLSTANLPSGASFVDSLNGRGRFSWTPGFTQAGTYNVTFIASDGNLADSEIVAITVFDAGNQRPVLAPIGAKSADEGQNLTFGFSATDPDATIPAFIIQNVPANASFVDSGNGRGSFTFNPDFFQAGTYNVRFIATDGALTDTELVAITVNNVNRKPVWIAIGNKVTNEGQLLAFNVSASDPDLTIPVLSVSGLPSGAVFVDSLNGRGRFTWTPTFTQAGVYNTRFLASDGQLVDTQNITITVNDVGNQRPVLAPIGAKSTNENQLLSFRISATDPDTDPLTLSAVGLPSGAVFVDSTNSAGSFSWTPSFTQSGSYNVTFIAADASLSDSEVVTITVNNINRAPVFAAIGAKSTNEGQLLSFRVSATDPDLTTPVLSAVGLPSGATFVDSLNGAGSFGWTPSFTQAGSYNVTFIASDGSLADSEAVAITVNNENRAPVLNAIGAKSVNENQLLQFRISSSDPDGTTPVLSAVGLPSGATFVDSLNGAGSFTWTPTFAQAGNYNVTFIASDGTLADSEVVTITVNNVNRAPVLN